MASSNKEYTLQNESQRIFESLVNDKGLDLPDEIKALAHTVKFTGDETQPFFPVPYKVAETQAGIIGIVGLLANAIGKARSGVEQDVEVDVNHAMLGGLGALFFRHGGGWLSGDKAQDAAVQRWDHGMTREMYRQLGTNVYQTKDGRWYQLHGSMDPTALLKMLDLPQHDDKNMDFMGIVKVYQDVIKNWDSELLDDWSNNVYRTPGSICYEVEEFAAHPHGIALKDEPWYKVIKQEYFSQSPVACPKTDPNDRRPLAGIKILDLSRAIAAPTISRVCAALGATVIRVSSEVNTELPLTLIDGCTAKISVDLNLKTFEGRKKLMELIKDADIFVDGYRPSVLEHLGFGRDAVLGLCAKRSRGIIYVQENCYGWKGPWVIRPGWAQIADTVSGIGRNLARFHGFDEAHPFPGPNADYLAGHGGAAGALQALYLRHKHGGSYVVQCSLLVADLYLLNYGMYTEEQQERLKKRNAELMGTKRHYDEVVSTNIKRYAIKAFVADRKYETAVKEEYFQTIDGAPWGLGPIDVVRPPFKLGHKHLDFPIGAAPPGYHLPQWTVETNQQFVPLAPATNGP